MTDARSEIIERITDGLGEKRADRARDYDAIARSYRQTALLAEGGRLELFTRRLEDYGVSVYRCETTALIATIAQAVAARSKRRLVAPPALAAQWIVPDLEIVADTELSYTDLDASEGVVTACTIAIALTGTIVLTHGPREGRRALTLIPDYHLCIVDASQVVETVPEAFRFISARRPPLVTTISGPSATADIEMTRVEGVHGPRTLDVVLTH